MPSFKRSKRYEYVQKEMKKDVSSSQSSASGGDTTLDEQNRAGSDKKSKRRNAKHKTTEFSYLLERKALRIMRRYFKEGFDERYSYKQRIKDMQPDQLNSLIEKFTIEEIPKIDF